MKSRIEGVSLLDDLHYRSWNGAIADLWSVECSASAHGEYISEVPRLVHVFESQGILDIRSLSRTRNKEQVPAQAQNTSRLFYIPAGMTIWSETTQPGRMRHLDVHLDIPVLEQKFGGALDKNAVERPRLLFSNAKIEQLSMLLVEECLSHAPLHDLYGEGLINALVTELFHVQAQEKALASKLSSWRLRRVTDFIEDNFARIIRLQELADLTGLSETYFCSAFKASTGVSPHTWQMKRRIARAQAILVESPVSLTQVAALVGFSDQAHFTRVFKKLSGTTPAAWLRQQL